MPNGGVWSISSPFLVPGAEISGAVLDASCTGGGKISAVGRWSRNGPDIDHVTV